MKLPHPSTDQISLTNVLAALGDPTRLAIVRTLATAGVPMNCGTFAELGSKTNISYHLAKLREVRGDLDRGFRHIAQGQFEAGRARPALSGPDRSRHRHRGDSKPA